jgi:predicted dithiol-disulfide oxidoreductase (DUF899 family)
MAEDPSETRPAVVDRATFEQELDALRAREKAHTREGDAIAAARRRLAMVEVAADSPLLGPHGPVTLLDAFEGRRQLVAYYFMWWPGRLLHVVARPTRSRPVRRLHMGDEPRK